MKKIIFINLVLLLTACSLYAQVDVQNNGIVYIGSATDTFFVGGAFVNASGSAFTNNGIAQVKRDLTNDQSAMAAGTGTLYLNGAVAQAVGGAQTLKTNNLITNNSAGITLNNNLSVSGLHTFTAGLITTAVTPNYMIYEAGSSYTGDNDSRHIDGWVKKIGNTDFIFPVGSNIYERTVALTGLTANSEFDVKRNPRVTPNFIQLLSPLVLVDTSEYWRINKISGGAANISLNWNTAKVPSYSVLLSDVRIAFYDAGISYWTNIGGTATGNTSTIGSVTTNNISIFNNNFTLGSISFTLPLQITNFTGKRSNDVTKLNWTVANEMNIQKYELQRSDDAINFYTINTQYPFNTNNSAFYSYDDRTSVHGQAYYRVRCTGNNMSIKYSDVVKVSSQENRYDFYVIKNPVDAVIEIYADNSYKGIYNYTLVNTAGQLMQSGSLNISAGGVQSINLQSNLTTGTYVLLVKNAENILRKTIIKQ
ncbi:MAG: hypothetical protein ABJA78_18475 [Ferruginibacter sp.]